MKDDVQAILDYYKEVDYDLLKCVEKFKMSKDKIRHILRKHKVFKPGMYVAPRPSRSKPRSRLTLRFAQNLVYQLSKTDKESHNLATVLNISHLRATQLKTGCTEPTITEICKLANLLEVDSTALFDPLMIEEAFNDKKIENT